MEERRHQSDMLQVFKILQGHDNMRADQWFKMAADRSSRIRMATGLLNLTKPWAKLEVRANFFSVRMVDTWNAIPEKIKMAKKILDSSRGCVKPTGAASVESEVIWRRTWWMSTPRSKQMVLTMGLDGLIRTPLQVKQVSKCTHFHFDAPPPRIRSHLFWCGINIHSNTSAVSWYFLYTGIRSR